MPQVGATARVEYRTNEKPPKVESRPVVIFAVAPGDSKDWRTGNIFAVTNLTAMMKDVSNAKKMTIIVQDPFRIFTEKRVIDVFSIEFHEVGKSASLLIMASKGLTVLRSASVTDKSLAGINKKKAVPGVEAGKATLVVLEVSDAFTKS